MVVISWVPSVTLASLLGETLTASRSHGVDRVRLLHEWSLEVGWECTRHAGGILNETLILARTVA